MPSQFSFSSARLCRVQKLQFGILSPDEVVSIARWFTHGLFYNAPSPSKQTEVRSEHLLLDASY